MLPDIDLLFRGNLEHRGLTHSIIISSLIFLPAFIIFRKKSLPYFAAFVQHALIGDYLTGEGIQLLWPITFDFYTLGIGLRTLANISIESTAFIICIFLMFRTKDIQTLMKPHPSNLLLFIPITAIFFSAFSLRKPAPPELLIPHTVFITIFTLSILADLKANLKPQKLSGDLSSSSNCLCT